MTKDELIRVSRITGMKPHQQEKHYIQTLILRSIYSGWNPVFKGGTALMFLHGLNRFSEDLDFTAQIERNPDTTSGSGANSDQDRIIDAIVSDLEFMGIKAAVRIITDNEASFSFRIGAEGPLFTREIERCYVRVEISRREKVILSPQNHFIQSPYPQILPFSVNAMNPIEMLAEKVRAILTRNRARDVYDIYFLLNTRGLEGLSENSFEGGHLLSLINNKLKYYGKVFDAGEFERAISMKEDIYRAELTPIVFGPLPVFEEVRETILKALSEHTSGTS